MKDKLKLMAIITVIIGTVIGLYVNFTNTTSYIPSTIAVILLILGLILLIIDQKRVGDTRKSNIIFYLAYILWVIGDFLKLPIPGYGFKIFRVLAALIALILVIYLIAHDVKLKHQHS